MDNNKNDPFNTKRSAFTVSVGLAIVLVFFMISGFISFSNTKELRMSAKEVARTHDTLITLRDILLLMQDAETGQRGYVLTGDQKYLAPYESAVSLIGQKIDYLTDIGRKSPQYARNVEQMKLNIDNKFSEMEKTIALRESDGFDAALAVVKTDQGKEAMDAVRRYIAALVQNEEMVRAQRFEIMDNAYNKAVTSGIMSSLLGIILAIAIAYILQRETALRNRRVWVQEGQRRLADALLGNQTPATLGDNVLKFFAEYFGTVAGAFFIASGQSFRRVATYGIPDNASVPENFGRKDGLLGQAVTERRDFYLTDVPDGYLSFGSSMGGSKPHVLYLSSVTHEGKVNAAFEIGFLNDAPLQARELLKLVGDPIGAAIRAAEYRQNLQEYLEETQRQSEELQAQSEELRVSNEELEEQSRALKESQTRLEQQQVELEQTNSQLEEQAQQLENQRNNLVRVNDEVERKAREVEQASKYKSDFLANMSHELRTPLNSSLILSKLLADNPDGNLTTEQVKFAQTIQSAGNDLLTLINDILDLSKIEAGYMDIVSEPVRLSRIVDDLRRMFEPIAEKKSVGFSIETTSESPDHINTDKQRLEQVLRNLLSNAFKFTEKGGVTLFIGTVSDTHVTFSVRDTGIGISEEQQQAIFEAFKQADSTISRKFGGTGLGLSISRHLIRLLGGTIELSSIPGEGSTFKVTLPLAFEASAIGEDSDDVVVSAPALVLPPVQKPRAVGRLARTASSVLADDRDVIQASSKSILVVEDDVTFAAILRDLAHEMDFKCLHADNADDALALARQYMPSAIVLDVGLPDTSGLSVLDRLKRDIRTRHIPVHVVSANDYAKTAMSMGAMGYALKPVKREELADVFKQFEQKIARGVQRVLVVEDDDVQRESIARLLESKDVEIIGAASARESLELLKTTTFDCMVLDLTLPDANGYSLLETMSSEDVYSFPPVIIYTGRDLDAAEERKLRRYSKSIIIKGAKSPERLLDEVTLFLHQVVSELAPEQQKMLHKAKYRDEALEGKRILIVEDDTRNVYSLSNILEPRGAVIEVARNGMEALEMLQQTQGTEKAIDLILMDVMMPEMDGMTATREIRKRPEWKKLPVIMLTAKAMRDDQEQCLAAGANDYMAKPLDVEKLLSLVRVWMPR